MTMMTQVKKDAIIKTDLLCKSYVSDGETNNVIKNMSLSIYDRDFTVVMGCSGSGKSTLLYTLSGMIEATSGKISFNANEITHMKEKQMAAFRRDTLGFVFQGINLVPDLTVFENVISPSYGTKADKASVISRADELLNKLDMSEHTRKFPHQLSGGQNQRAAICRALINNPKVIFADEPTGALNSAQGKNVLDIFTELNRGGQSVVMVTHDLRAALRGNRIIYLRDGRIDGELSLEPYDESTAEERESCVYEFLKKHGF